MVEVSKTIDRAYELFSQKKFEQALETIEEAENVIMTESSNSNEENMNSENLSSIENFRGFVHLGLNESEKAKACFEKAMTLNPNSSQACAGLAEVFYLQNQDEEAKIMFEWAIDVNPDNVFAKTGLAKVNKNLGLPDNHSSINIDTLEGEELEEFNTNISNAFKLFESKQFMQSIYAIEEAEKVLLSSLMSNAVLSKLSSLDNFKGFNYLAIEDFDQAQSAFEKALNLNPTSSQACAGLGELFYLKQEDEKAKVMFEWAIINNPENNFAISGLNKVNMLLNLVPSHNSLLEEEVMDETT